MLWESEEVGRSYHERGREFREWFALGWKKRIDILKKAAELISQRQMVYGGLMAIEVGKNRLEALGEVEEAADLIRYYAKTAEDNDFYDHPKFTEAGPLGTALWLAGMAYCNRNFTDGYIPASKARSLLDFDGLMLQTATFVGGGAIEDDLGPWASAVLIVVGLWHEDGHDCPVCPQPGPRRYYVHDYLEYQPSKAQVEETRAIRAAAGRKGGQARGKQSAKQDAEQPAKQNAKQNSKQNRSKTQPQSQGTYPTPRTHHVSNVYFLELCYAGTVIAYDKVDQS